MFQTYLNVVTAVWLVLIGLMMETKNLKSFLVFKFVPLCLGVLSAFLALKGFKTL